MSLSSITLSGTLKEDPKKRFTPTNIPVTNLLLEVCYLSRAGINGNPKVLQSQTVRVNAWRDLAEECERKYKAGDKILVIGKAQVNAYTTNEGKKKRELEIDATSVVSLNDVMSIQVPQSKKEEQAKPREKFKKAAQDVEEVGNLDEIVANTEEIPF